MEQYVKYGLLEIGTMEQVRDYYSLEDVFKDLLWKCPTSFWVGVVEEKQAYTIPQFLEKYKTEYETFIKNHKDN